MAHKFAPRSVLISMPVVFFGVICAIGPQATAVADPLPYGPDTCIGGYVWRNAQSGDTVCVTPAVRDQTAQDNSQASQRVEPGGGAYGPDTCKQGFVWREAFGGDHVCVTPATRTQAANDNAAAASRKAANQPPPPAGPPPCLENPAPGLIPSGQGGFC
jgi:hypothetical protein